MKKLRFLPALAVVSLLALPLAAAEMALIPGGEFMMGDAKFKDAKPVKVKISPFLMDKYEVTQQDFAEITGTNPSNFRGNRNPVERIRWNDAARYCNLRSEKEGLKPCYSVNGSTNAGKWGEGGKDYKDGDVTLNEKANGWRLPTEEEWLAAADDGHAYSGGDSIDYVAWYIKNSEDHPQKVGTKAANTNGLYDMTGNVYEWCWDKEGSGHIRLGGSWSSNTDQCAVSKRSSGSRGGDITGFRPVRNAN